MIEIETSRVKLRPFKEEDLNELYEYAKVEGVGERAGWKHHANIEESKAVLLKFFIGHDGCYAIVDKKTDKVIGSFDLREESELTKDFPLDKSLEVGYVLSKDYWNQGIMSEILAQAINSVVKEGEVKILTAIAFSFNKQSITVLEKNGFHHYKVEQNVYHQGMDSTFDKYCFYRRIK